MDEWLALHHWMISPHAHLCRLENMDRIPGIREFIAAMGSQKFDFWHAHGQTEEEATDCYEGMKHDPVDWGILLPPADTPEDRGPIVAFPRKNEDKPVLRKEKPSQLKNHKPDGYNP